MLMFLNPGGTHTPATPLTHGSATYGVFIIGPLCLVLCTYLCELLAHLAVPSAAQSIAPRASLKMKFAHNLPRHLFRLATEVWPGLAYLHTTRSVNVAVQIVLLVMDQNDHTTHL